MVGVLGNQKKLNETVHLRTQNTLKLSGKKRDSGSMGIKYRLWGLFCKRTLKRSKVTLECRNPSK